MPNFKINSLIGDSEVKDTKKILMRLGQYFLMIMYREKIPGNQINVFRVNANKQENNNQEKVDCLFTEEESKQGKSKADQSFEKVHHSAIDWCTFNLLLSCLAI